MNTSIRLSRVDVVANLKALQGDRSQKDFAREIGISPAYLNDIYHNRRDPGAIVLKFLNLRKTDEKYEGVK